MSDEGCIIMTKENGELSSVEMDRAIGVVIGGAVGDALGAGFEFVEAPEPDEVQMRPATLTGEPAGCWTDDTAMAIAILEVAAQHGTLATDEAASAVGERFLDWFRTGPGDVGGQISAVLTHAVSNGTVAASALAVQAKDPERAGNGSLMRTGPVALAHLGDEDSLVAAARTMSSLTHPNDYARDACVLWTLAIDDAIRHGRLTGPRAGLDRIDAVRRQEWDRWITDAETRDPRTFSPNGFVVTALQAAWSAIYSTRQSDSHFTTGLRQAVAIGDDADTVAAIAGSLLGAAYGVSSIPSEWRQGLAGWPKKYSEADLVRLAARVANGGRTYA